MNDLLKVENMDKYYAKEDDNSCLQLHEDLPQHKKHGIICGSTGSGKSNLVCSMITKQLVYDRIYVLSRHIDQPCYNYIKKNIEMTEKDLKKRYNVSCEIIMLWTNDITELPNISDFDKEYRNLVIIDDFAVIPKVLEKKIVDYYTRARHHNCSVWFLGQMYFSIPRAIRLNCGYVILFNNHNAREIRLLDTELSTFDKNVFKKMYKDALSEKYSFMMVDNVTKEVSRRFRKGFSEVINVDKYK